MARILLIVVMTFAMTCETQAGTKDLMARAKAKLIALNNRVLKRVPAKDIPANGYVKVKADVKGSEPDEHITIKEIKTTSNHK